MIPTSRSTKASLPGAGYEALHPELKGLNAICWLMFSNCARLVPEMSLQLRHLSLLSTGDDHQSCTIRSELYRRNILVNTQLFNFRRAKQAIRLNCGVRELYAAGA